MITAANGCELPPKGSGFGELLVRAAALIAYRGVRLQGAAEDDIRSGIAEGIGLVLDQIRRLRDTRDRAINEIVRDECEVGSDLLQMDSVRWWYLDSREARWRDRQHLLTRRAGLGAERLRLDRGFEQELRGLEERLLLLMQRHRAVGEVPQP